MPFPLSASRIDPEAACSNELRTTKAELERAKEHVQQYQVISETQGESLREVTATYDEFKAATESSIAEKDVRLAPSSPALAWNRGHAS
mgnify:CR=1 FL=1